MKQYKIGFAFSGGGAKGAAHCGALQALHEYGIKADVVAGTSAGSIAATLYASGVAPIDMANMFATLDFKDLLGVQKLRGGIFDTKPLVKHLRSIIPYQNLEELPIPATVVATSLERGCVKFFSEGEIAPRVAASCSIPIVYQPQKLEGEHYVDGGVLMNLPVTPIRDCCEKVIALNLHHAEVIPYKDRLTGVAVRCSALMFLSNVMMEATRADTFINIDTSAYSAYDLSKVETLFHIGYDTAVKQLEEAGYTRVLPAEKLTFAHKEKKPDAVAELKLKAQEMIQKSEALRVAAADLVSKATGKKA